MTFGTAQIPVAASSPHRRPPARPLDRPVFGRKRDSATDITVPFRPELRHHGRQALYRKVHPVGNRFIPDRLTPRAGCPSLRPTEEKGTILCWFDGHSSVCSG